MLLSLAPCLRTDTHRNTQRGRYKEIIVNISNASSLFYLGHKRPNLFSSFFQSGELLNWQKECSGLSSEDKLVQTDVIHSQEAQHCAHLALSNAWNKLRSRSHLRPILDSISGMDKIINILQANHREVNIRLGK